MKNKLFEHLGGNRFKIAESTSYTYDAIITDPVTDADIEVTVEYDYHKAARGSRERGSGLQLEPDEPAHIEINSVKDVNGKEYKLTKDQRRQLEDEIIADINDRANDRDYEHDDYLDSDL